MSTIELRHITKRFGDRVALDDVSLSIADGEFVAMVGPTGCGKSTLLRLIGGLDAPTDGDLLIDGVRVNKVPARDRRVGMVSQEYALYPHLSVYENLAFPLRQSKALKGDLLDARVRTVAQIVSLGDALEAPPSKLSGGQRQRVALGRAIMRDARILLLDEPLSNLDAFMRPPMIRELSQLQRDLGVTTAYVTHDQMDALRMADRIAVFDRGRLQQLGTAHELLDNPANVFVASFIGLPPMSFVAARLIGDLVHVPFGLIRLSTERLSQVAAGGTFLAGVRPLYAPDDMVLDPADDDFVQITDDQMEVPYEMLEFERDLAGASKLRPGGSVRSQLIASLHAEGLMPPGRTSRVYIETGKIHLFDPATGVNLTKVE